MGTGCEGGGVEAMADGRQQGDCWTMGVGTYAYLVVVKGNLAMFVAPTPTWMEGDRVPTKPLPIIARVPARVTRR